MTRSAFMSSALTAAFAASIGISSPAHALEAKQCLPMAEMNAALKADGQRTMLIGDRVAAVRDETVESLTKVIRAVNTVTSNSDGSLGYQLEGDRSRAEPSSRVCVRAKLTDVQLFDARKPSVAKAAYLGGAFDKIVDANAANGNRPAVVASTVFGSDDSLRRGLPIVIFKEADGDSASITTMTADGKPTMLVLMNKTEYTSAALQRLGGQLASLSYNGN